MKTHPLKSISERSKSLLSRTYLNYRKTKNKLLVEYIPARIGLKKSKIHPGFQNLRHEIDQLKDHIDRDYAFLDIPGYGNVGDHMIYQGSIDFLDTLPFKQTYGASINNYNPERINDEDLIILQGGGNFGDIWKAHQEFRELIIQSFPDNKIIIFPQTIFFREEENLENAVHIFSDHPNLIICARDVRSFETARNYFKDNTILLIPDMAFYMNMGLQKKKHDSVQDILYMKRSDKELESSITVPSIPNLQIKDWPPYNSEYFKYLPKKYNQCSFYINEGIYFMSAFDLVISTRLHGSILAALLGIPVILIDNSYGKNKMFYKTWLESVPDYYFCANNAELDHTLETHFSHVHS